MPRGLFLLIILVVLIVGLLFFLSSQAEEVPMQPIDIEVNAPANAG